MYSKLPISMDNIPRQKSFGCLSLKIGCIISGLVIILYTVFALAPCLMSFESKIPSDVNLDNFENVFSFCFAVAVIIYHVATLMLTTIMMVGAIKEKPSLMKPWVVWTSFMVIGEVLLIVFCAVVVTININNVDMYELLVYYLLEFSKLFVHMYILTLVASYYMNLEEERFGHLLTLLASDTWQSSTA